MKMIYLTLNISELDEMLELLNKNKIGQYQIYDKVCAGNKDGIPRMNNAVWPGYNATVIIQADDAEESLIADMIKQFNHQTDNPNEKILMCSWQLERLI
jgi:hypothetical protein